jgi:hypothetical protein
MQLICGSLYLFDYLAGSYVSNTSTSFSEEYMFIFCIWEFLHIHFNLNPSFFSFLQTNHSSLVQTNCNMSASETRSTGKDEMSPPLSPKRSHRWTLLLQNEVLIRNKFSSSLKLRLDHLDIIPFPKMNKVAATRSSWMICLTSPARID